uniref:Uncharacterized protein n=1 Tax=Arundo donax TaxID=35708 RepID=A0A0A8Z5A9_ARUDO
MVDATRFACEVSSSLAGGIFLFKNLSMIFLLPVQSVKLNCKSVN